MEPTGSALGRRFKKCKEKYTHEKKLHGEVKSVEKHEDVALRLQESECESIDIDKPAVETSILGVFLLVSFNFCFLKLIMFSGCQDGYTLLIYHFTYNVVQPYCGK